MTDYEICAIVTSVDKIVRKSFSATDFTFIPRLLKMADYIDEVLPTCNSIFEMLEDNSLLDSRVAIHLWFVAVANNQNSRYLEALIKRTSFYCQMYCQLIADQDFATLISWHNENTYLDKVLPTLVGFCVEKNRIDTSKIISALIKLENRSHCSTGLLALYNSMVKNNLKETFALFELFFVVWTLMEDLHYTDGTLHELKQKTPLSIDRLLWNHRANFKVINEFYGESLSCEEGTRRVITSPPKRVSEEQVWTILIHGESHLAALRCETFDYGDGLFLHQAAGIDEPCLLSGEEDNFIWKLIPTDGELIKISSLSGKFLAADQPKSGNNALRVVYLKNKDNTSMQLWKFE